MTLPNFIVIGPGKTGTTWLYRCLLAHPEIRLARHTKEIVYFTDYYDRGTQWYESFFAGSEGARAIGEVSNTYFFSEDAPARVSELLPNAKLISFLRNPIERIQSLYLFRLRNGLVNGTLEEAIAADPEIVRQNMYYDHLQRWLKYFPREQLLVALNEDIRSDPDGLLEQIYAFLDVDPSFRPDARNQTVLSATTPRAPFLFRRLKRLALWLREHDFHRILTWAKMHPTVMKLLTQPIDGEQKPQISVETRKALAAVYAPQIVAVEELLGRSLSGWE